MLVVAVHFCGSGNREGGGGPQVRFWHMRVTVSMEVSHTPVVVWIKLICCSTMVQSPVISSVNVCGSKGCGVSWVQLDEEASLFTRDEGGLFGSTDHQLDSPISGKP